MTGGESEAQMSGKEKAEKQKRLLVKDQNGGTKAKKRKKRAHACTQTHFQKETRKKTANYRVVKYRSVKKKKSIRTIESTCHQINRALQSSKWLSSSISEKNIL